MQRVFVLDKNQQPIMPCHPARARKLLASGKAAVFRQFPFTIVLNSRETGETQPLNLRVDPGSKTTGLALVLQGKTGDQCVWGANLNHRGQQIKDALEKRRAIRRSRRNRKLRYRKPRFLNRTRPKGWLPPSVQSRVDNLETWSRKLKRFAPVSAIQVETVRFDTQLIENPTLSGADYQQGDLAGWEVREYLLYRHKHTCAYCAGLTGDNILEKEHIIPKSLGGVNRLKNFVIACRTCNEDKNALHPNAWAILCHQRGDKLNLKRSSNMHQIMTGYRPSLKDAVAMNATRYAVGRALKNVSDNVTFWSGGRTKKNRTEQRYPKEHWVDAACIGERGNQVKITLDTPLIISAKGHGSRQMCRVNKYGFPRTKAKEFSSVKGFQTGDMVKAKVTSGKKTGTYFGRVAVRKSGYFNIQSANGVTQGVAAKFCQLVHRTDGYNYSKEKAIPPTTHSENRVAVSLPKN